MILRENIKGFVGVTGASGFIGRELVKFLKNKGFKVRVLINKTDLNMNVEKFYGSIHESNILKKFLDGVDILFHLAAALGNRIISDDEFNYINRDGTESVLRIASKMGVKRVVYFSSAGVYGKSSGIVSLKETANLNPIDIYERSKLEGEKVSFSFVDRVDLSIIRPGWVYGEGDRRTFKLIKQINSGFFFIPGQGNVKHSPIYIGDLLEATLAVALKGSRGEIYNIGGKPISVKNMVKEISMILDKKLLPLCIPISLVYPVAYTMEKLFSCFGKEALLTTSKLAFFMRGKPLNSDKIKDELGVNIGTYFLDGIKKAIQWYKGVKWL